MNGLSWRALLYVYIHTHTHTQEWYFGADPFEDTHGWQDLSPEEWTPRFEYGGNRIPIRVQVCVMCAHAHSPAGSCGVYATRYLLS